MSLVTKYRIVFMIHSETSKTLFRSVWIDHWEQFVNICKHMFIRMANVQGKLSSSLLWMTENDAYRWRKWWVDESGGEEKKGFNRKQLLWGFALCWFTVRGEFTGTRQTTNITLTLFSPCCLSLFHRTQSDTTCPYIAGLSECRMRGQVRALGGCLTLKAAKAASHLDAGLPPWTTTASLPRAEDEQQKKR